MPYALSDIRKFYGEIRVLDGFSFSFPEGRVTALLGPSGCGKTTLLNVMCGLVPSDSGDICGFRDALFSYVFQEPRLVSTFTALENVELVLRSVFPPGIRRARALRYLETVGLAAEVHMKPGQLSGGMRQRVSLARAFAYPADVLLLDEPFQAVDLKTRIGLMDAFLTLESSDQKTVVFVTHEVREALYLGDIVAVLSDKPARVLERKELLLPRVRRRYGSSDLSGVEAALYRLILGETGPVWAEAGIQEAEYSGMNPVK